MKRRTRVNSEFSPMFRHFTNLLVNRVRVNNLPEEIDEKFFLYHVLLYGRVLFFRYNDKYHVMWFSGRGKFNEYYIQKEFLVTNPYMENAISSFNEEFNNTNSAIVYSDVNAYIENADVGLYDFVKEYSELIDTIDKSIKIIAKNARLIAIFTGNDVTFVESARVAIDQCFQGDKPFIVMEESLVDSIKVNPISEKMDYKLSELIKARQYYISDFYQKIGVSANQNMKAERLTDNESQLIDSVSSIDFKHIIDFLNDSIEKVNKLFSLNISFELNEEKEVTSQLANEEDSKNAEDSKDSEHSSGNEKNSVDFGNDKGDEKNGDWRLKNS